MISGLADLDGEAPIFLFEWSDYNLYNPEETTYFCNYPGVIFEGIEYQAIACEGEGYDLVGQGQVPNPTITLSNVGRVVEGLLYQMANTSGYRLEGSTITRRVTKKKFLDGQSNANDAIKEYPPDIYRLEQVPERTYQAVKIIQSTPYDLEGMTLPARIALRSCGSLYRGDECGYVGSAMFTNQNTPTLDPSKDVCAKTLTACKLRFGSNAVLPFGGFPGLGGYGTR